MTRQVIIPGRAEVRSALDKVRDTVQRWQGEAGPKAFITVSPGSIQLRREDIRKRENRLAADLLDPELLPQSLFDSFGDWDLTGFNEGMEKRGKIYEFSRKSRSMMTKRLATLDYSELFEGGRRPAMITLTLPGGRDGEWLRAAPDGSAFHYLVRKLIRRFEYSYGYSFSGVWKREFQRRGAPHFHILMAPPLGRSKGKGQTFQEWLSLNWAIVCKFEGQTPENFQDHVRAGTGIDYDTGLRSSDPKRIAVYFSKHGLFGAKEYQNRVPEEWADGVIGRFWGYWGLERADIDKQISNVLPGDLELTETIAGREFTYKVSQRPVVERMKSWLADDRGSLRLGRAEKQPKSYLSAHRTMSDPVYQYWLKQINNYQVPAAKSQDMVIEHYMKMVSRRQSYIQKTVVFRQQIDFKTGEVKTRTRRVNRRKQFYNGGSGYLVVNDGIQHINTIARLTDYWIEETGNEVPEFDQGEFAQNTAETLGRYRSRSRFTRAS